MLASNLSRDAFNRPAGTGLFSKWLQALRAWLLSSCPPGTKYHSCPRSVLKKELTKRPPFLVKSLVCKSSEKTVNGGWRDGRTLEPFSPSTFTGKPAQFAG